MIPELYTCCLNPLSVIYKTDLYACSLRLQT